jgi:endonuclease/exonuclease/phosphatase family metal-dependent hydrolase
VRAVSADAPSQPAPIVFASYNVHRCIGTDGRKDIARVARVLRALDAGVIALQEVDCFPDAGVSERDVALLSELSGVKAVWAPTRQHRNVPFGNALLTSWPVEQSQTIDLSYRRCEPRAALDVYLRVHDKRVRVIATHLGLRPDERRYQVQKILESVEHREDCVTVLLGDINEWFIPGRPLRWLHQKFGWGPAVRSFPAYLPILSLDRIWMHPPQGLLRMWAFAGGEARNASDHLPVLAEITLDPIIPQRDLSARG